MGIITYGLVAKPLKTTKRSRILILAVFTSTKPAKILISSQFPKIDYFS